MMRLLGPLKLLRRLCGEFDRRASEAGLPRPLDLGLLVEGRKYQIELGREGAAATAEHIGRSYLRLNVADFTRLVLGQLDWEAALSAGAAGMFHRAGGRGRPGAVSAAAAVAPAVGRSAGDVAVGRGSGCESPIASRVTTAIGIERCCTRTQLASTGNRLVPSECRGDRSPRHASYSSARSVTSPQAGTGIGPVQRSPRSSARLLR